MNSVLSSSSFSKKPTKLDIKASYMTTFGATIIDIHVKWTPNFFGLFYKLKKSTLSGQTN